MILANVRERITDRDIALVVQLLARGDPDAVSALEKRATVEGIDVLLDSPELPDLLRETRDLGSPSAALFIYVTMRNSLRTVGIDDIPLSDYLGALVLEFGLRNRAFRIARYDDDEFRYLTDILRALQGYSGRRAFLLRAHLGNYSLWLAGVFPDYIVARRERRGAPGFRYYEDLGASGYRLASDHRLAHEFGLRDLYRRAAASIRPIRIALNRISDRLLFPVASPVRRLRTAGPPTELG